MIKGLLLGICIAIFAVSAIIIVSGIFGGLSPNLVTGQAVKESQAVGWSFIGLVLSVIIGLVILIKIFIK